MPMPFEKKKEFYKYSQFMFVVVYYVIYVFLISN